MSRRHVTAHRLITPILGQETDLELARKEYESLLVDHKHLRVALDNAQFKIEDQDKRHTAVTADVCRFRSLFIQDEWQFDQFMSRSLSS